MPIGSETRVNTYVDGSQSGPEIVSLSDGGWVITWESSGQDGSSSGIFAQAYTADGTPQGGEFKVNTYTASSQYAQQIEALSDGGWVISWSSINQDGDSAGAFAQAYNANGTPRGSETQINTYTTSAQLPAGIAALDDGGWVITWTSLGQDGSSLGIYAQIFDANGTAQGDEFRVNTYIANIQSGIGIDTLNDGGWVITWRSKDQDGSGYGIYAQAYNADGTPQNGEQRVNTYAIGDQISSKVAALDDGGWIITWQSALQDGDGNGIYAQAYNADGTAQGGEIRVNTFTTDDQSSPQISALTDGGWVITWTSNLQDNDRTGIYAQAYNADGSKRGGETQVNTYTTDDQSLPQITALSDGGWVITWVSDEQDGDNDGVFAQRFSVDGTAQGPELQVNTYTDSYQNSPRTTALSDGGWVTTWSSLFQDDIFGNGIYSKVFRPIAQTDDVIVSLTGTQEVDQVLTADVTGIDLNDPTLSALYFWSVGSDVVATTTDPDFTLLPEHAGLNVTVHVNIMDQVFEDTFTKSATSEPIFDGNDAPTGQVFFTISDLDGTYLGQADEVGQLRLGNSIEADEWVTNDPDGTSNSAYSLQWMRGNEAIENETSATYTVTAGDEGYRIKLALTYTDDQGFENVLLSTGLKVEGYTGEVLTGSSDVDQLLGTSGDDLASGGAGADVLIGFQGNDHLKGGSGKDLLIGNRGRDVLKGGNGDDVIQGGNGADKLIGGAGNDWITGGTGADLFIFSSAFGDDVVTDFEIRVDRFQISNQPPGPVSISQVDADTVVELALGQITFLNTSTDDIEGFFLL